MTILFALTATAYTVLFVLLVLSKNANRTRTALLIACAGTIAATVYLAIGPVHLFGLSGALVELAISGGWCLFTLHLLGRQLGGTTALIRTTLPFGIVVSGSVLGLGILVGTEPLRNEPASLLITGQFASRLALCIYGALLTENLYRNTAREARWHINLLCIALGILFGYGILLYADALLFRRISPALWDARAIAMLVATPLFAVSAARNPNWAIDIHVSRATVFHTATLIGSGIFLIALALTGEVLKSVAPSWGGLAEMTLVTTGVAALAVVVTSGSARSRLRWFIAENFYSHRYDYRQEWIRSSDVLSTSPTHNAVQTRVINAVANIADSPAGILCVRDLNGIAFQWAGSWNCPAVSVLEPSDSLFVGLFRNGAWIIELDLIAKLPQWLEQMPDAWLAIPLAQQDELIAFIVLLRPRAPIKLDRETFDLLRVVARQAASHVAEQRYAQALAEAQKLRDYGKRFAFIAHDMKNVASQLRMIIQNARRHGEDPEFQKDVLATVHSALNRMDELLARLRPEQLGRAEESVLPAEIINEVVTGIRRSRGIQIDVQDDGRAAAVAMDPAALRSIIAHLCENAVDACGEKVQVRISHGLRRVEIEVADDGNGMTAEFIRDKLFQPFGSTKANGFGVGAYQARELVRAAGGDLLVASLPGRGTTMRILLPSIAQRSTETDLASRVEAGQ